MTNNQLQLLMAAILQHVAETWGSYASKTSDLIDSFELGWEGSYTRIDIEDAIENLDSLRLAHISSYSFDQYISIQPDRAQKQLSNGEGMPGHPSRIVPLLEECASFGGDWLREMWNEHFVVGTHQLLADLATREKHMASYEQPKGLTRSNPYKPGDILAADVAESVIAAASEAERKLDGLSDNAGKAQMHAYLIAIRQLAGAPDPPADMIWQLIARAADITQLAMLVAALVGLLG